MGRDAMQARGYRQWVKTQPVTAEHLADALRRFHAKVEITESCWLWRGRLNGTGYGTLSVRNRTVLAHKWGYEQLVGPIPDGLEIDHTCRVRACVNPAHLEPVTHLENMRRGAPYRRGKKRQRAT